MSEHRWHDTYNHACHVFGQNPRPADEQAVIEAFERNPVLVRNQVDAVAAALKAGSLSWGWSALAKRVQQAPSRDVTVTDTNEQERRIRGAERWLRNAGVHLDRETELLDELFGDLGTLRDWRHDEGLRERMVRLWREERPRGERCESEAVERAVKYRRDRERVAAKVKEGAA